MSKIKIFVSEVIMMFLFSGIVFAIGETVSWNSQGPDTNKIVTIVATPSSTSNIITWIIEGISIPSGWTLQSAVYSGGNGMGAGGCNVEGTTLNCAYASSTPAGVANTLTIKLNTPSTSSSATLTGSYTTITTDETKNSNALSLQINGGGGNGGGNSGSGSFSGFGTFGWIIGIAVIGFIIYQLNKNK